MSELQFTGNRLPFVNEKKRALITGIHIIYHIALMKYIHLFIHLFVCLFICLFIHLYYIIYHIALVKYIHLFVHLLYRILNKVLTFLLLFCSLSLFIRSLFLFSLLFIHPSIHHIIMT